MQSLVIMLGSGLWEPCSERPKSTLFQHLARSRDVLNYTARCIRPYRSLGETGSQNAVNYVVLSDLLCYKVITGYKRTIM